MPHYRLWLMRIPSIRFVASSRLANNINKFTARCVPCDPHLIQTEKRNCILLFSFRSFHINKFLYCQPEYPRKTQSLPAPHHRTQCAHPTFYDVTHVTHIKRGCAPSFLLRLRQSFSRLGNRNFVSLRSAYRKRILLSSDKSKSPKGPPGGYP